MKVLVDVYITLRAAPSGGWYGYVRERETHAILTRTGLQLSEASALARASAVVSSHAYEWHRVPPPDDAPPLFPDAAPPATVDPEPTDLELAALALRQRAEQLRGQPVTDPASRDGTAATLDNVAAWLDRQARA